MDHEIEAIYTVWLREMIRYVRAKERIITSIAQPLFWLVIFGSSIGLSLPTGGIKYQSFIAPGIIVMAIMFTSMFSGISVIWDRELGFMKEMLVAPISRLSIVVGKCLGGATTAVIQGILVLLISFLLGVRVDLITFLILIPIMMLIALGIVGIGVAIASILESMEGFGLVMNFIIMPMFFLSGALFPINNLPNWLKAITFIDPVTYDVELTRYMMIGISSINFMLSFIAVLGFTCLTLVIGAYLFNRRS
jgi:ABC-2 type transport system permease protein